MHFVIIRCFVSSSWMDGPLHSDPSTRLMTYLFSFFEERHCLSVRMSIQVASNAVTRLGTAMPSHAKSRDEMAHQKTTPIVVALRGRRLALHPSELLVGHIFIRQAKIHSVHNTPRYSKWAVFETFAIKPNNETFASVSTPSSLKKKISLFYNLELVQKSVFQPPTTKPGGP